MCEAQVVDLAAMWSELHENRYYTQQDAQQGIIAISLPFGAGKEVLAAFKCAAFSHEAIASLGLGIVDFQQVPPS